MVMMRTRGSASDYSSSHTPCLDNPDLFFAESPADIARAKQLCALCPVTEACLAGALERSEPWGVCGGELVLRGTVIASKRGRGRPRGSSAGRAGRAERAARADRSGRAGRAGSSV
jgi:WhiB family redox-sensing transcriptional regulator